MESGRLMYARRSPIDLAPNFVQRNDQPTDAFHLHVKSSNSKLLEARTTSECTANGVAGSKSLRLADARADGHISYFVLHPALAIKS